LPKFLANRMRVMLAALACTLLRHLKRLALKSTELAHVSSATIRVRLLKIGAAIRRNTRRLEDGLSLCRKLAKFLGWHSMDRASGFHEFDESGDWHRFVRPMLSMEFARSLATRFLKLGEPIKPGAFASIAR
jgi:hypothetical protein